MRYLWDDAEYLWLTQRAPDEDRFLSCNLNISWPDQGPTSDAEPAGDHGRRSLSTLARGVRPDDHHHAGGHVPVAGEDDRFAGWLSYSNFDRAWKSVNTLHELLRARGLGMRQWSRDLFIPRGWR